MDEEFAYLVPIVFSSEGQQSAVLDARGQPYVVKQTQKFGFELKPKRKTNESS